MNSDFSYVDLGDGNVTEVPQQQQQPRQQQQQQQKLSGRKRSFPHTSNWDNLGPKALSEISASLLAGNGWDIGSINNDNNFSLQQPAQATLARARAAAAPAPPCSGTSHSNPSSPPAASASKQQQQQHAPNMSNGKAPVGAGCSKGRRGAGAGAGATVGGGAGAAKRLLNPDRMERKASREKRRREEASTAVPVHGHTIMSCNLYAFKRSSK